MIVLVADSDFQMTALFDIVQSKLIKRGVLATIRRTRGDDIDAACGQLAGQVQDRTRQPVRLPQLTVQPPSRVFVILLPFAM